MYLTHIIINNLLDEAEMEDKMRVLYVRSDMLLRKCYFVVTSLRISYFPLTLINNIICVFAMGLPSTELGPTCASLLFLIINRFE